MEILGITVEVQIWGDNIMLISAWSKIVFVGILLWLYKKVIILNIFFHIL